MTTQYKLIDMKGQPVFDKAIYPSLEEAEQGFTYWVMDTVLTRQITAETCLALESEYEKAYQDEKAKYLIVEA